jgi:hypothetical protein
VTGLNKDVLAFNQGYDTTQKENNSCATQKTVGASYPRDGSSNNQFPGVAINPSGLTGVFNLL